MKSLALGMAVIAATVAISPTSASAETTEHKTRLAATERKCIQNVYIVSDATGRVVSRRCGKWKVVQVPDPPRTATKPTPTAQQCVDGLPRRRGLDGGLYCTGRMRCAVNASQTAVDGDVRSYAGRTYMCERQTRRDPNGIPYQPSPAEWRIYTPPPRPTPPSVAARPPSSWGGASSSKNKSASGSRPSGSSSASARSDVNAYAQNTSHCRVGDGGFVENRGSRRVQVEVEDQYRIKNSDQKSRKLTFTLSGGKKQFLGCHASDPAAVMMGSETHSFSIKSAKYVD